MNPGPRLIVFVLLLGAATGCFGTRQNQADHASEFLDDKVTAARVQAVLQREQAAGLQAVQVTVTNGTAYLSGSVPSAAERQRALALARSVHRVKEVRDQMRVEH